MQVLRLCFSCALLACTISVSDQQTIQISTIPSPLIFLASSTFQLSCMYTPSQHTFQHWVHPDGTQLSSNSGRFTVRFPSSGTTRLIVAQSEQSDEGTYHCVFQTSQGTSASRSMVAQFRHAVTISTPDNFVYTVTVGDAIRLLCDAQYHTITQWQDSGRIAISNSSDGRVQIQGTSLFYRTVGLGDNGTYYCVVRNERSLLTLVAHLLVQESPSVTIAPPSAIVNPSESITFICEARGSPRPSIIWTNEETGSLEVSTFLDKQEETVSDYVAQTNLIFSSVREQDTGTYRCAASNSVGSASSIVTLQLIGTPGAPQRVELSLVNFTSINVTWLPPDMDGNAAIVSYTVMWLMASGSRAFSYTLRGPALQTHYLIPNLQRVTVYTVLVHASNQVGRGRDSEEVNITTSATVPGAPLEVTYMDVAPTSVQVEWRLSSDDGGTPVTGILVYYRTEDQQWGEAEFEESTSLNISSLLIRNLRVDTWYQLQVVVKNRIGFGPPRDSTPFRTPPPGFPASPSHISVKNITDSTAIICWVPSDVGRPFLSYTIHAIVNSSSQENGIVQTIPASDIFQQMPNCTEGAQIVGLVRGTCYTFTVAISNNQGLGQPSAGLDVHCTPSTPVCVNDDCTPCTEEGICVPIVQPGEATGLSSEIIAVLVICSMIGVVLLIVAVLLLWKISSTLKHQKSYTFPNIAPPSDTIRRESSRSDKVLLEYDREQQSTQRQFQKQFSIGNSSSVSSQNSVSDQDTPNTATTIMSDKNPFSFTPPIAVHMGTGMEYPRSASLGSMGRSFHIYPIPEHAPAHPCIPPEVHPHPHTLPNQWQVHPYPISKTLHHQQNSREEFEMIENPLNRQFEEEKQAELEGKMVNFSHEVEDPEDEIPPPVPPYRGEDTVDNPSLHPPPSAFPYLGESFSQPSHSPRLPRNNCEFYIPSNDEEEDVEFVDNDAYEKISPQPQRRHPPRFEIKGQKRGAIFETVDLRH